MTKEKYGIVKWQIADIKDRRPDWTDKQCHDFLQDNERHIKDRMTETGWEVIDTLMQYEDDNEDKKG